MVQNLEGVAFIDGNYYDNLNYFTTSKKLMKCQGGLKWGTLSRNKPSVKIKIRMRPKTKRMVPYSFFGVLVYVPIAGNAKQNMAIGDTTDITHVYARMHIRYNEWNQDFDMKAA